MPSWFRVGRKSKDSAAAETLIRVCIVSRDAGLVEEVHKSLMIGFATRGGYEFESDHPDFQQFGEVLLVDLRTASGEIGPEEGLAFIDAVRASGSHPPVVALCDANAGDFDREVMRRGAYDKLNAPLNMPQLRLMLQRAYEFRLAETKLESFLSRETAAHEQTRKFRGRIVRAAARPAVAAARPAPSQARRSPQYAAPSRLAIGFVLGCVLFFAGLVAVRTIISGMGDALASAGLAADSGAGAPGVTPITADHPTGFVARHIWPLSATADFGQGGFGADGLSHFHPDNELAAPGLRHSSLSGYEAAALVERVTPRYSQEARARHLQGTVRIRAIIGTDGVPRAIARASGDPALAQIAVDAIALWRYAPATLDGEAVESEVIIPVDFQLPD